MKISNSKKELARIISENGGWRDGAANWSAMDGLRNGTYNVAAYGEIPAYQKVKKWHKPSDFTAYHEDWFQVSTAIKNFHQTILSREEYFHLYPAQDADGWIEWKGCGCPVDGGNLVEVKLRNPPAGNIERIRKADEFNWKSGLGDNGEIIAYRLHNPEQAKPEFCESVMRSIPESESKPTIEQLAADYRNANDYAERKQQEADAAKGDAEDKLKALELACEALGIKVSPITAKQEPELAITDWRDLRVGDEVECLSVNNYGAEYADERIGSVGRVIAAEEPERSGQAVKVEFDNGECYWISGWRFIRRP